MFRLIKNVLITVIALYIGILAYYTYNQRDILYHPTARYVSPLDAEASVLYEEFSVKTEDGLPLKGWYAPATRRNLTLVFFHGNADSVSNSAPVMQPYLEAGYGVVLAEYRGFSGQPGTPDESGLYRDGRAFISTLFDKGVDMNAVVFMGHSLGTGVAVQLAREFHPVGVVLFAPFLSAPKVAAKMFPYFPTEFLVFDRFANEDKVAGIQTPLLVLHGDRDKVVPLTQGQKLFDKAQEPKRMEILSGFGHSDLFDEAAPTVLDWLPTLEKKS